MSNSKFEKIVLIDDNDIVNFYNEDLIKESGLFKEIIVINNGTDAIEYFNKLKSTNSLRPSLILLDIKMPDYDGFEILEELENLDFNDSPICILTTSNYIRDREKYIRFKIAVEFLEKPLTEKMLLDVIEKHLKK